MSEPKPITIIGGGLAGLTLGIGLRQRNVPVIIREAGNYPRHRVCGGFISGRGQLILERLGIRKLLDDVGAVSACTAAFFTTTKATPVRPLPAAALCVSRHTLDALLAERFRELGGELQTGARNDVTGILPAGMVRATGRRLQADQHGPRWFGLKMHARRVALTADLEMHVSPRGYVGLCRINGGEVNICGLFRRLQGDKAPAQPADEWLRGEPQSLLRQRLNQAEFDPDSFCAVAGLSLQPQRATRRGDISLGDAITMIPPLTGNGMSMAFESAELAIEPLVAWSRGGLSWGNAHKQIARACDHAFDRRLAWAKRLQYSVLTPWLQNILLLLAARSDRVWRLAFDKTR